MARCTWAKGCPEPAAGELQAHTMDREPWPLCDEHLKPEHHPEDLRDKLTRWPA